MTGCTVAGEAGETLLEALRMAHQPVDAPCGGRSRCLSCLVHIDGPDGRDLLDPPSPSETGLVGGARLDDGWRLACQARFRRGGALAVTLGDSDIDIPDFEADAGRHPGLAAGATDAAGAGTVIAVDIGTTTVVAVLVRRTDGVVLGRVAAANPERAWGADVLARIDAALASPDALAAMRRAIHREIEAMLVALADKAGLAAVPPVFVAGNTTMLHLLEGADVGGLAALPFRPAFLDGRTTTIGEARTPVRLVAGISAFVGADILAGLFATRLDRPVAAPELLLDIGTNGEMALAVGDRLYATATAAGPAFEGGAISCGSIARKGAIDHVWTEDGAVRFSTIGKAARAGGVCGSGLLDALASLRRLGIVDEYGGFEDDRDAFSFGEGQPSLTQGDIRALQLAKGAIAAGVDILCRRAGIEAGDIARVHLAGGFGSTLLPASALDIGLLPAAVAGRIEAAGNTSLAGTLRLALEPDCLARMESLRSRIEVVDLAADREFQDAFVDAMLFPELEADA